LNVIARKYDMKKAAYSNIIKAPSTVPINSEGELLHYCFDEISEV
jgi:hypothetical protein